jgi:hypothetical protein
MNLKALEKLMMPVTVAMLVALGLVFYNQRNDEKNTTIDTQTKPEESQLVQGFGLKMGEMGNVTVEVIPINVSKYQITFDTHSVPLDFDFLDIIKLVDSNGKEYSPISWSGGKGGHHQSGELIFSTIDDNTKTITLIFSEIEGGVLNLTWVL